MVVVVLVVVVLVVIVVIVVVIMQMLLRQLLIPNHYPTERLNNVCSILDTLQLAQPQRSGFVGDGCEE